MYTTGTVGFYYFYTIELLIMQVIIDKKEDSPQIFCREFPWRGSGFFPDAPVQIPQCTGQAAQLVDKTAGYGLLAVQHTAHIRGQFSGAGHVVGKLLSGNVGVVGYKADDPLADSGKVVVGLRYADDHAA